MPWNNKKLLIAGKLLVVTAEANTFVKVWIICSIFRSYDTYVMFDSYLHFSDYSNHNGFSWFLASDPTSEIYRRMQLFIRPLWLPVSTDYKRPCLSYRLIILYRHSWIKIDLYACMLSSGCFFWSLISDHYWL